MRKISLMLHSILLITSFIALVPVNTLKANSDNVAIDSTNFPDDSFRQYVGNVFDENKDEVLTQEEISKVTELNCPSNTQSIEGVQYFKSLISIDCTGTRINKLELSDLPALEILVCNECEMSILELSDLPSLTTLNCSYNKLSSLDVSGLTSLTKLNCSINELNELDISNLTSLKELYCNENQISSLEINDITSLEVLVCSSNLLKTLDVSNLTSLKKLNCSENQMSTLDVTNFNSSVTLISNIFAGDTNLQKIKCKDQRICSFKPQDAQCSAN